MTVLDGLLVWVWNVRACDGGDTAAIVARLKSTGAAGAIVKICDGTGKYNTDVDLAALRQAFRTAGLTFATWGYNYGISPAAEGQLAGALCAALQPDIHVFDAEQEVENSADPAATANAIVAGFRAQCSGPIAYSPLPAIRYHLKLPYRQLTDAGLPMLPQLYWTGLQWSPQQTVGWFYADAAQYDLLTQPVYPAYEDAPGARADDANLAVFLNLIKLQNVTGASVWSYEHLDAGAWQRAATVAQALAPAPVPVPPTPPVPTPPDPPQPPVPPTPTGARTALAQLGINVASAALDPGLADDEAIAAIDSAERQIYDVLYPSGSRAKRKESK